MKHKRKMIPFLLAFFLFLGAGPIAVAAGGVPTLTVTPDRPTAKPGETVTFTVRMTGNFDNFLCLNAWISFPATVFEELCFAEGDLTIPGNECLTAANADVKRGFAAFSACWLYEYTGNVDTTLMTVTAKIRPDAATGSANVVIAPTLGLTCYSDITYEEKPFVVNNPAFSIIDGAAQPPEVPPVPSPPPQRMTKAERKMDTLILQIGNYAAAVDASLCHIYSGEKSIVPYIRADAQGNGRTMVPVRFVAERLGATVLWEQETRTVVVSLGGNVIRMAIGSSVYTINGTQQQMDAAAEIKDYGDGSGNGRTMVPLRFVAEGLGKAVKWQQSGQFVIITEPDALWDFDRTAEQEVMNDVTLLLSPLVRDFINTEEAQP